MQTRAENASNQPLEKFCLKTSLFHSTAVGNRSWNQQNKWLQYKPDKCTAFMTLGTSMLVLHTLLRICYGQACISLNLKAPNFGSEILDWCWAIAAELSSETAVAAFQLPPLPACVGYKYPFMLKRSLLLMVCGSPFPVWCKSCVWIWVLFKVCLTVFDCLSDSLILLERHNVMLKADFAREVKWLQV